MTKKDLKEQLQDLPASDGTRTLSARVNDFYDEIEIAIDQGVSHNVLLKTLCDAGLQMSPNTFKTILKRLRKKHQAKPAEIPAYASVGSSLNVLHNTIPTGLHNTKKEKDKASDPNLEQGEQNQEKTEKQSHDPKTITDIMKSAPDLDALARAHKLTKRKKTT